MQKHKLAARTVVLTMALLATSCAAYQASDDTDGESIDSYEGLVAALRANGSTVEPAGPVSQPFFVPEGKVMKVDGNDVQVFEFSIEQETQAVAETISPDGSSVGTSMIMWVEAPHFYESGKLIVLYVGEEDTVVDALVAVLGTQIAGR